MPEGEGARVPVAPAEEPSWVFGYGSLIWRPDIRYDRAVVCRLEGWRRVFWQGSPDHRGTPDRPGRVVTLIRQPGATCWGRAYHMTPSERAADLGRLDVREQGGYERHQVQLNPVACRATEPCDKTITAFLWIASSGNEHHLGPAPMAAMAAQVAASVGPSGPNSEYVFELERALGELGGPDRHVTELAAAVRRLTGPDAVAFTSDRSPGALTVQPTDCSVEKPGNVGADHLPQSSSATDH